MFGAILKATNSSFKKGMTFCRSIYVKKVMKLLAFIFEQPAYKRTCTKTCIAICFRKTSVYRNGLYISICNSSNIESVSLCLVPF